MMNRSVIPFRLSRCLIWLLASHSLHGRTFTSPDGKSFEGEIVSAAKTTVVIERGADRRRFTVPIASLSAPDQTYIAEWKLENPDLKLSYTVTNESRNTGKSGSYSNSDQYVQIVVKNSGSEATPPLQIYYTLATTVRGNMTATSTLIKEQLRSGRINVPPIPAFQAETVSTHVLHLTDFKSVTSKSTRQSNGEIYTLSTTHKYQEDLKGLTFVVYFNNRELAKWSTPGIKDKTVDLAAAGFPDAAGGNAPGLFPQMARPVPR